MITKQEKKKLKVAESTFKSVKKNYPQLWKQLRDETIRTMVKHQTPEWGNLRFVITKNGI